MAGERFDEIKRWCDDFCERYGTEGENGPAHVVVSDYNFEDDFVNPCLREINAALGTAADHLKRAELTAARDLLMKIRGVPDSERLPFDGSYYD